MSRELERMRKKSLQKVDAAKQIAVSNREQTVNALDQMIREQKRVTDISRNAPSIIENLDKDFKTKTKLQDWDVAFLFLATALQCARQYLLSNDKFRFQDSDGLKSNQRGDKFMRDTYDATLGKVAPKDWKSVLFDSVPYDAFSFYSPEIKADLENIGLSGANHRYRTLGHDPALGWIFGTANIITSSLTRYDFHSFSVRDNLIFGHYPGETAAMLYDTVSLVQRDPKMLAAGVARQAIHFGSDYFTKQGLPVPLVASVNNDLAANMLRYGHIDMWSITRGAALAALINYLIYCVHLLFYDESKDGPQTFYEVRTRKILSYSNAMATGSNIIVSAFTQDATKLDIGGMIVTIHRLLEDQKFINEVKRDFLKNEIYKMVVGDEYDFVKGD